MTTNSSRDLPLPPLEILQRAGNLGDETSPEVYREKGRHAREAWIESLLPDDWTWAGKKVLDFGCGAGRVLSQFADEPEGEFWGCDIDRPSIAWLDENVCPPFHVFPCDETPGLPCEDGFFDLIYALSVYTHITDHWAGWLLEHHRALAPDGLLLVSFLGEGMLERLTGESWIEENIGMNALLAGYPWDRGGPITFNSLWWIRAHWGRAFEILAAVPYDAADPSPQGHGRVLMRRKDVTLTEADLIALEPDEPREISAMRHHAEQLRDETLNLRAAHDRLAERLRDDTRNLRAAHDAAADQVGTTHMLQAELERLRAERDDLSRLLEGAQNRTLARHALDTGSRLTRSAVAVARRRAQR